MEKRISLDESLDKSHTNSLMACEGAGAGGETEDGQCRVSVHYEGEGDPGTGVTCHTGHTKTEVLQ